MSRTKTTIETIEVPIEKIKPSPYQPRLTFDLEDIRGSVQKDGILVALTVREKNGYYELIDGERRLRLAKELGYKTVSCNVIDVDDETAMGMVWTVNIERKDYSLQEKVRYAIILKERNLSIEAIAKKMRYSRSMVRTYLNVNRLPEKYQILLWQNVKGISIAHLNELQSFFNGNVTTALKHLDVALERKLTKDEFYAYLKPNLKEVERSRVESAKKAVGKIVVDVKEPESPEELEKAAKVLRKEAEKRKTPEQKAEEKRQKLIAQARKSLNSVTKKVGGAEKTLDVTVFRERLIELEKTLEQNPAEAREQLIALGKEVDGTKKQRQRELEEEKRKKREEEERRRLEEEMRRKLEEEKRRIEEEAKVKTKKILLEDKSLLREASDRYKELLSSERLAKRRAIEVAVEWKVTEADLVHKIVIGDAGAVLEKIGSPFVDLIVTSPPYFSLKEYPDSDFRIDAKSIDMYLKDLKTIFEECFRVLKDGRFLCVIVGQFTSGEKSYFIPAHITQLLEDIGFNYKREHIWVKPLGIQGIWNRGTTSFLNQPYPRNTMINIHHEHILIFQKGDKPEVFYGRNPLSASEVKEWCWSIWELTVSHVKDHPAPFPETIVKRLIKMYSYEGEIVLDPFLGSGTTSKVAKALKRRSVGIEVSPEYIPLIKQEVGGADIIRYDQKQTIDFSQIL